jgi:HSP20 family protein
MTNKNDKDRSRREEDDDSTALAIPGTNLPSVFDDFFRPFDGLMESAFPQLARSFWTEAGNREPNIDVQDRGDHFVLTAELPGFEKKDLEVRVSGDAVELKAEKRSDSASDNQRQSSYSYFQKYLTLPEHVLSEKVDGTMKNGVLELKLPKKEPRPMDRSRKVDLK